jgi:deoxyribonuclease V
VAVDVHYLGSGGARAAAVVTADDRFSEVVAERAEVLAEVLPYRPGDFYLRELPPIRAVLSGLSLLVVDGYADLDSGGRPGLGAHAHAEFDVPVIGVAKSAFPTATHAVPVLRGTSVRPLFVTAAGMPRDEAVDLVRHMAGQHRLPDAIRRADTLARTSPPADELTHSSTADQARIAAEPCAFGTEPLCINIRPDGLHVRPCRGCQWRGELLITARRAAVLHT